MSGFVSRWRMLAPAGNFLPPWKLNTCVSPKVPLHSLEGVLGVPSLSPTSSGKSALVALLTRLRPLVAEKTLHLAAYTCPDIAVAALRAGYRVVAWDIEPRTLIAVTEGRSQSGVVLLSNLFGLPEPLPVPRSGMVLVDDACQALLSKRGKISVGSDPSAHAIYSFGRGKAICGLGGGAFRLTADTVSSELVADNQFSAFIKASVFWALEHPLLYRLPMSVPGLKLGETLIDHDFIEAPMRLSAARYVEAYQSVLAERSALLRRLAERYQLKLRGIAGIVQPFVEAGGVDSPGVVPIRYPIIAAEPSLRDRLFTELARLGMGVSKSYPLALPEYPQLEGRIDANGYTVAKSIASRILTLPLHRFVREADIDIVANVIERNCR